MIVSKAIGGEAIVGGKSIVSKAIDVGAIDCELIIGGATNCKLIISKSIISEAIYCKLIVGKAIDCKPIFCEAY